MVLTLVVAIRASASVTGEKERGTWLALMLTTLSTREIILGKHRGIFAACVPYIAGHAAVTFPLALLLGFWATIYAVCSTLIMLLAVVLGSALGIWCSSRASSTWRRSTLSDQRLVARNTFARGGAARRARTQS